MSYPACLNFNNISNQEKEIILPLEFDPSFVIYSDGLKEKKKLEFWFLLVLTYINGTWRWMMVCIAVAA